MRRALLFILLIANGCRLFGDPDEVVLRDAGGDILDVGITDATSPRDGDSQQTDAATDLKIPETCGDGLLQPSEVCDPSLPATSAGACPTACDDGLACTTDTLVGNAVTCNAACSAEPITICQNGDGCCPGDCTPQNDLDCDPTAVCGDGTITGAEQCDPGIAADTDGACPTDADTCPPRQCEMARLLGAPQNCDRVCAYIAITSCTSGDGCCAPGCDESNDDDCRSVCGNSIIEPGEGCDGNCPTSCDDGDACTIDTLEGDASTCDASCSTVEVTACQDGDGCCPAACNSGNDDDCSPSCGNAVLDPGESCDPISMCPASCDDLDDCTIDTLTGSAANCNVFCTNTAITACRAIPDGCCPPSCNANNDSDCAATCGNDVVEPGEACDGNCPATCDDGNVCTTDVAAGTAADCTRACTNTTINACLHDDGCCPSGCNNITDNDCGPVCGNGITEPGEACDGNCPALCSDGNACTVDIRTGTSAQCNVQCAFPIISSCVDGDGCCAAGCNANNDTDCSASCGNGVVEAGEKCDGNCPSLATCTGQSLCMTLAGNAAQCNAECVPIPGCQTCDLGSPSTCNCQAAQLCAGICKDSMGEACDKACDPNAYCEAWGGPGSTCNLVDRHCIVCQVACTRDQICAGSQCLGVARCDQSPDPDYWCEVHKPGTRCIGDKCI